MLKKLSKTKLKELRIDDFLSGYEVPFKMEDAGIDLRTMAENYEDGIIPSADVTAAVNAVIGDPPVEPNSVDPRDKGITPSFAWVPNTETAIDPRFQRDIAGTHVLKIELDFDSFKIIVPCAVKHPKTGLYLIWDGNHTRQVCERQGWTHIPVWYIEIPVVEDESDEDTIKRMVQLAGEAFLSINKKNKRAVSGYDEHKIRVETFEPTAVNIQMILDANDCTAVRNSEKPGEISHYAHLYEAFELTQQKTGIKGLYLSRALDFHRKAWPKEDIDGIVMLSLARLYAMTEAYSPLPPAFDAELTDILREQYGPAELVQTGIKKEYNQHFGGDVNHRIMVTSGLILSYNKHNKLGFKLAAPEATFPVR